MSTSRLETALPIPSHSYYPYPLSARHETHRSILQPLSPYAYGHQPLSTAHDLGAPTSSSTASEKYKRDKDARRSALRRAEKRALAGLRPIGTELSKEADELSEEERVMEDERVC